MLFLAGLFVFSISAFAEMSSRQGGGMMHGGWWGGMNSGWFFMIVIAILIILGIFLVMKRKWWLDYGNFNESPLSEGITGTKLPFDIIVQEISGGQVKVTAIDPLASIQAVENPKLKKFANEIVSKLKTIIDRV